MESSPEYSDDLAKDKEGKEWNPTLLRHPECWVESDCQYLQRTIYWAEDKENVKMAKSRVIQQPGQGRAITDGCIVHGHLCDKDKVMKTYDFFSKKGRSTS